jgi:hypothetical protein
VNKENFNGVDMLPTTTEWIAKPHYQQGKPNWLLREDTEKVATKANNYKWIIPMSPQFAQPENIFQVFTFNADNTVFPLVKQTNVHRDVFVISASEDCKFYCMIKEQQIDRAKKEVIEVDQEQEISIPLLAGSAFSFDPTKIHYLVGEALFLVVDRDKNLSIAIPVTAMESDYLHREDNLSEMERDILKRERDAIEEAEEAEVVDCLDCECDCIESDIENDILEALDANNEGSLH